MSKSRLEWKVGIFVFIGLVLLAGLLLEFSKGMTFLRPTYQILLRSSNVGGLKIRAAVLMSGVQVGSVTAIALAPDGKSVTITLRIYSQYVIHSDARFVIEQSGFLGDQYVSIIPTQNESAIFTNNAVAHAEAPFNMQEFTRSASGFIQRVDETIKKLNDSLVQVRELLLNPQTLTNLSAAAVNLRVVSDRALVTMDKINAVLDTNAPSLSLASSNLVVFSEQMNQFAGGLNELVSTNSPEIHVAVKNLETSSETLKNLLGDVQAGKGLAGSLLKNEHLAADVARIAYNLSITSSNLNRLGLWGILWHHKPAKPPEPAPDQLTAPKNPFQ